MIYVGKVKPSLMDKTISNGVVEFFKKYQPLELSAPGDE
ncbi:hypothetical protein JOD14_001863 [Enterococcus lemanii]|nr:hypothetical protein [Enterococcus lemanii]